MELRANLDGNGGIFRNGLGEGVNRNGREGAGGKGQLAWVARNWVQERLSGSPG